MLVRNPTNGPRAGDERCLPVPLGQGPIGGTSQDGVQMSRRAGSGIHDGGRGCGVARRELDRLRRRAVRRAGREAWLAKGAPDWREEKERNEEADGQHQPGWTQQGNLTGHRSPPANPSVSPIYWGNRRASQSRVGSSRTSPGALVLHRRAYPPRGGRYRCTDTAPASLAGKRCLPAQAAGPRVSPVLDGRVPPLPQESCCHAPRRRPGAPRTGLALA